MGQAKQRGTFEQRKADAIERDRKQTEEFHQRYLERRKVWQERQGKSHAGAILHAALLAATVVK